MNASNHPKKSFSLEDFPFHTKDKVRFADLDPLDHVNNAVVLTYFESGRVALVRKKGHGLLVPGLSWVVAKVEVNFLLEMHYPGDLDLAVGVSRIGRTSATFKQAVFCDGKCAALGETIGVMIDDATRKPAPLPPELIANLQRWAIRDEGT